MQVNLMRLVLIKEVIRKEVILPSATEYAHGIKKSWHYWKKQWQWSATARHLQQLQQIAFFRGRFSVFSKIGHFVFFYSFELFLSCHLKKISLKEISLNFKNGFLTTQTILCCQGTVLETMNVGEKRRCEIIISTNETTQPTVT